MNSRFAASLLVCAAAFALPSCNAYRAYNPSSHHDSKPPELPASLGESGTQILLFSKTNGFRHEEAIPAGLAAIGEIAESRGWDLFATENGAVHNSEQLARFDVLVWFQVSGDVLDDAQKAAFKAHLEGGGGVVAIHGSGGDRSYVWDWYVETLLGAQFIGHPMNPQFQEATLHVADREHPATRHLAETWVRTDEWYSFAASPRAKGVRVLATLDESSYRPRMDFLWMDEDLAMGEDHPVVWSHCVGEGRVFYSALGHQAVAYEEPEHRKLLEGAIAWAAGLEGGECRHPISPQ